MEQDNEDFRSRVSQAVFFAIAEAGRVSPGSGDTKIDVNAAIEGMAQGMSTFLTTIACMVEDREQAADMLGKMEELAVSQLRYFADRIREGTYPPPDRQPPDLRVVD